MRIVIFRESRFWLAQALEHDVGVQAGDLRELVARMETALTIEGGGLTALPPAPKYFQDLWPLLAGRFHPEAMAVREVSDRAIHEWGIVA